MSIAETKFLIEQNTDHAAPMTDFVSKGYHIVSDYISTERCAHLLSLIDDYRKNNDVPSIFRSSGGRPLHYSVIDGARIRSELPEVSALYTEVFEFVKSIGGRELVPFKDQRVACNINITSKGGSYRWHYDRNKVSALLYLNEVEGGETDCYPNYRISPTANFDFRFQRLLDQFLQTAPVRRLFGKRIVVKPRAGKLLIFGGNKCLHSVRPVTGNLDRVNIVMSFDLPGKDYAIADRLNEYLYTSDSSTSSDPNYA